MANVISTGADRWKARELRKGENVTPDTEVTTHQDILTCGSCQKPFPLGDIVKFIQHKILICNKENYSLSYVTSGETCDDNSDDGGPSAPGQPLGVVNSRRPSISAPINSKKSCTPNAVRLVCSPPATSPKIPEDEATTSTPKRRAGSSSPLGSKDDVENHLSEDELKPRIKQELDSGSSPDDVKKIRGVDAESNTTHSEKRRPGKIIVNNSFLTRSDESWDNIHDELDDNETDFVEVPRRR
ncbi:hypothetical protein RUM44_013666 [Polyplax serrata]|uniref:BCL-11A-like CCHC zinc finger domain-containing protein n=1 Tax=Polyplax serrata TaxID=468196 RepID=A0ABR1BIE6_POLSC